jgi:hypothetical protein
MDFEPPKCGKNKACLPTRFRLEYSLARYRRGRRRSDLTSTAVTLDIPPKAVPAVFDRSYDPLFDIARIALCRMGSSVFGADYARLKTCGESTGAVKESLVQ